MPTIRARAIALVAMAFAFVTGLALAQDMPEIESVARVLKMELSGFAVTVPAPYWTRGNDAPVAAQFRATAKEIRPGLTSLVLHQSDENAIYWTELMGVLAIRLSGFTAGQQFKSMADSLVARCMPGQLDLWWIVPQPGSDREALVGMCGSYTLKTRQAQRCVGGIFAAVAVEHAEGVVSAYSEWCTQSFDVHDDTKWPVSRDEIEAHARLLQANTEFKDLAE